MTESVEQTNARNARVTHVDLASGGDSTGVVVLVRGVPCWCVEFEERNPNSVGVRANCPQCNGTGVDPGQRVIDSVDVTARASLLRDYRSRAYWPPAMIHAIARAMGYQRHTELIEHLSALQELIYERTRRVPHPNIVFMPDPMPPPRLADLVWRNVPDPDAAPAASHVVRGNEHGRSFRKPKNQNRCNVCGRKTRSGEGRCPGCGTRR